MNIDDKFDRALEELDDSGPYDDNDEPGNFGDPLLLSNRRDSQLNDPMAVVRAFHSPMAKLDRERAEITAICNHRSRKGRRSFLVDGGEETVYCTECNTEFFPEAVAPDTVNSAVQVLTDMTNQMQVILGDRLPIDPRVKVVIAELAQMYKEIVRSDDEDGDTDAEDVEAALQRIRNRR